MTDGLSYPALRCVLEHLEANKRIHITSRSTRLRLIDKSIPLRLDVLIFKDYSIQINDLTYSIDHNSEQIAPTDSRFENRPDHMKVVPGDYQVHSGAWNSPFLALNVSNLHRNVNETRIPTGIEKHVAIKTLTSCWLGERADIRVDNLEIQIYREEILRVPIGLIMRVRKLFTSEPFHHFLPLIDRNSFPLQSLNINTKNPEIFKNPIVNSTDHLTIYGKLGRIAPWILEGLMAIPIRSVQLHNSYLEVEDLAAIIQNWLQTERKAGSILKVDNGCTGGFVWWGIKERFNFVEVQVSRANPGPIRQCLARPINSTSKLYLLGQPNFEFESVSQIVLKVLTSRPAVSAGSKRKYKPCF